MFYTFGPFRYDAEQRLLFRAGEVVPLFPKAIDILHLLLERRGRIVEKAELLSRVWPDTAIEEVGLARNISLLRKALDDRSEQHPYIETIPRRAYRFAAAIGESAPPRFRLRWLPFPVAALLLLIAAVYLQFYRPSRYLHPSPTAAALAVVPFDCLCDSAAGVRFAAGLTDLLAAELAQLPGIEVTAPSTVRRHQHAGVSMGLMGRLLGLDVLVEGTVQSLPGTFRITTRLVDVHTGKIVWAQSVDAASADPAAAQEKTAQRAAQAITQALGKAPRSVSEGIPKLLSRQNGVK